MARVMAIVDEGGRVVAAQLGEPRAEDEDDNTPSAELLPLAAQRAVEMELPDEALRLSGADLHRFFSHVEVSWPAKVSVPRIEVVRRSHVSPET